MTPIAINQSARPYVTWRAQHEVRMRSAIQNHLLHKITVGLAYPLRFCLIYLLNIKRQLNQAYPNCVTEFICELKKKKRTVP